MILWKRSAFILYRLRKYLALGLFHRAISFLRWNRFFISSRNREVPLLHAIFLYATGAYRQAYPLFLSCEAEAQRHMDTFRLWVYFFTLLCCKLDKKEELTKRTPGIEKRLAGESFSHFLSLLILYIFKKNRLIDSVPEQAFSREQKNPIVLDSILCGALRHMVQEDYSSARLLLEEHKERFSGLYFFNVVYMRCLFNCREYEEVVFLFEEKGGSLTGVDFLPLLSASLFKLGYYDFSKQVLEGIKQCEQPVSLETKVNRGKILLQNQRYIGAVGYFKNMLQRIPAGKGKLAGYLHFLLGISYQKLGMLNEALECYKVDFYDKNRADRALFNSFLIYYDNGMAGEASEILKEGEDFFIQFIQYPLWKQELKGNTGGNGQLKKNIVYRLFTLVPWLILLAGGMFLLYFIYTFLL